MKKRGNFGKKFSKKFNVVIFEKIIIVLMVLFMPLNTLAWPFSKKDELGNLSDSLLPKISPAILKNIIFVKGGRESFTKIGKEVFEEFLKVQNFDMSSVRQLLNRHSGSKLYHMYSAYCYGLFMLQKTSNPYEKEKIKRVIWSIAIEFSGQNTPKWKTYMRGVLPSFIWLSVVVLVGFWGSYLRKNNTKIFEKYSDKIFEGIGSFLKGLVSKNNGKDSKNN